MLRLNGANLPLLCVTLRETETFDFFYQEDSSLLIGSPLANREIERWNQYVQKKKERNYKTVSTPCQTPLQIMIDKTTVRTGFDTRNRMSSCSPKEIYYDMHESAGKVIKELLREDALTKSMKRREDLYRGDLTARQKDENIRGINAKRLLHGLRLVETVLSSHKMRYYLRLYARPIDFHPIKPVKDECPTMRLQRVLQYSSPKHAERQRVNCFLLHSKTKWIVFVGCGEPSFSSESGGALYCWNLKNSQQPSFRVQTPLAVTSLSLCPHAPQILGVALLDGSLSVYSFSSTECSLIFDTRYSPDSGCHTAPVWQLGWRPPKAVHVKPMRMSGELPTLRELLSNVKRSKITSNLQAAIPLLSLSEDGTIREWIFSKESGLLASSVVTKINWTSGLQMYRQLNSSSNASSNENSCFNIFPVTKPGTRFAFHPSPDANLFIVGTNLGDISLWFTFRHDSPIFVFEGHSMPITCLVWHLNPGDAFGECFLSSALDGTIKIWSPGKSAPVRVFSAPVTTKYGYIDADWCPWLSDLLMAVHSEGIHFWSLSTSSQSPIYSFPMRGITGAKFNPHSRGLVASDEFGMITFYKLCGLGDGTVLFLKLTASIRKLIQLDPFH